MGLHWGAPILQSLIPEASFKKLDDVQVDPTKPIPPQETLRFLHGETGEQIGAHDIAHISRLRRSKLRALLREGIDVQYEKRLTEITYSDDGASVTAHFGDGTTAIGSVLIGADGTRSTVRRHLLGPAAVVTVLPYVATIVQAKYTAEQVKYLRSWHPIFIASVHPAGLFSWVGMHDASSSNPEEWIMNHYISWASSLEEQTATKDWTNEMRLKQVKGLAQKFADPMKSAFEWLGDDQLVWYSPLNHWDPSLPEHAWDNHAGRVTLAGDAAHPMTFRTIS